MTIGARETIGADASVIVDPIDARATVEARGRGAVLVVDFTIRTRKATTTSTGVGVDVICASGSILTGSGLAFINVGLAQFSSEAVHAQAFESVSLIQTSAAIKTRLVCTIININETVATLKSLATIASIAAWCIDTRATVATGLGHSALVDIFIAKSAGESQGTRASVILIVGSGRASGPIGAMVGDAARVHFFFASFPCERRLANAQKVVDMVYAGALIFARAKETIVSIDLAIFTLESRLALTGV